jgi:adenosylcobinamide-GDP ribazoletransferase
MPKRRMTSLPLRLTADLLACLRFYSRLPVPVLAFEPEPYAMLDFARAVRVLPIAGAMIGAVGGLVLIGVDAAGLPPLAASAFALTALLLATGAFHEDGLADSADGLGGGVTRERKLEIMKDSRIGTYGGVALVSSLALRIVLIAELVSRFGAGRAALLLIAAQAASRVAALMPHYLLPPARTDGAAFAAARPLPSTLAIAGTMAIAFILAPSVAGLPLAGLLGGIGAMVIGAGAMTEIARRQIAGQTGDIAGASQQIAEILFFAVLASRLTQ